MKIVVLQPSFMPWLGHLDQYAWCDRFVLYDDVQYDKHGWRNRNRVLTAQGVQWLTIPVRARDFPLLSEVRVDGLGWRRKHLLTLQQAYGKAPYFERLWPALQAYYAQEHERLLDWNLSGLCLLTEALALPWKVVLSSQLGAPGRRTERLVAICSLLQATDYLTGDAAREYLDESLFAKAGVQVHWHGYRHPEYPQRTEPFVPYLSVLDLLFWCGPRSLDILWQTRR